MQTVKDVSQKKREKKTIMALIKLKKKSTPHLRSVHSGQVYNAKRFSFAISITNSYSSSRISKVCAFVISFLYGGFSANQVSSHSLLLNNFVPKTTQTAHLDYFKMIQSIGLQKTNANDKFVRFASFCTRSNEEILSKCENRIFVVCTSSKSRSLNRLLNLKGKNRHDNVMLHYQNQI